MTHDSTATPSAADTEQSAPDVERETAPKEPGALARLHARLHRNPVTGALTKIVVTVVGVVVLLGGLVMMVAPGPGIVGIILGLAILATEWTWADRSVTWARRKAAEAARAAKEMDPAVRRRRILVATGTTVAVLGACAAWVVLQDWPGWSVSLWDRVQAMSDHVPELPGM